MRKPIDSNNTWVGDKIIETHDDPTIPPESEVFELVYVQQDDVYLISLNGKFIGTIQKAANEWVTNLAPFIELTSRYHNEFARLLEVLNATAGE